MLHFAIFHLGFHGLPKYPGLHLLYFARHGSTGKDRQYRIFVGVFKVNISGYRSFCTGSHIGWSLPRCFFGNFNCPKVKGRHNHDNVIVDNFD